MKDQITLTDVEYGNRKKTTKREEFLNKMEEIIPWKAWVEMIRPYYPKGEHGRPVRGIETMLRMYLMQTWFNLSDEGTEDAIYDSYAMRSFLGINFMTEQVPDATTLLKFRHLLEKHKKGKVTIMKTATDVSWVEAENELYVINAKTNKCLVLDEVGKEIWLKILEVDTLTKLIEYFQSKYDISEHVKIANDIQELYNLLVSTEILCIDEQEI